MCIEGSLVSEKALDGPETYHLQHTSQGGFWLVTRVERSQVEVTEQVLDGAEKGNQEGSSIMDPGEGGWL